MGPLSGYRELPSYTMLAHARANCQQPWHFVVITGVTRKAQIRAAAEAEKPVFLLVAGYPKPGCQVPVHGGIKKPLDAIGGWL